MKKKHIKEHFENWEDKKGNYFGQRRSWSLQNTPMLDPKSTYGHYIKQNSVWTIKKTQKNQSQNKQTPKTPPKQKQQKKPTPKQNSNKKNASC